MRTSTPTPETQLLAEWQGQPAVVMDRLDLTTIGQLSVISTLPATAPPE